MKKLTPVIVVEGHNDTKRLQSFFDVATIECNGFYLSKETIALIKEVSLKKEVVLLLDPDHPGERIRQRINEAVPGLKNAFLLKENCRTAKKVGVEHASEEVLKAALGQYLTYDNRHTSLSWEAFNELGLNGQKDSQAKRAYLAKKYPLGKCNAKTLWKRLNMLEVTYAELKEVLDG